MGHFYVCFNAFDNNYGMGNGYGMSLSQGNVWREVSLTIEIPLSLDASAAYQYLSIKKLMYLNISCCYLECL